MSCCFPGSILSARFQCHSGQSTCSLALAGQLVLTAVPNQRCIGLCTSRLAGRTHTHTHTLFLILHRGWRLKLAECMRGNNPVDQISCSAAFTDRKYGLISAYQDTTDLFSFSFILGTRALSCGVFAESAVDSLVHCKGTWNQCDHLLTHGQVIWEQVGALALKKDNVSIMSLWKLNTIRGSFPHTLVEFLALTKHTWHITFRKFKQEQSFKLMLKQTLAPETLDLEKISFKC